MGYKDSDIKVYGRFWSETTDGKIIDASQIDGFNLENGTGLGAIQSISSDPEALNEASGADAVAIGKGCIASNKRAVAIGNGCKSYANTSIVLGQVNTANDAANAVFVAGNGNITNTTQGCVIGYANKDNGGRSNVVLGRNNTFNRQGGSDGPSIILGMSNTLNTGEQNVVIGTGNRIGSGEWDNWGTNPTKISNQTLIGQYLKVDYASTGSTRTILGRFNKNKADSVFELGAGNANDARYNAIEVLKDKTLRLFGAKIYPYAENSTHLFSIMDTGGTSEAIDITSTDPSNIKIDMTRDNTITKTDIKFSDKAVVSVTCGRSMDLTAPGAVALHGDLDVTDGAIYSNSISSGVANAQEGGFYFTQDFSRVYTTPTDDFDVVRKMDLAIVPQMHYDSDSQTLYISVS